MRSVPSYLTLVRFQILLICVVLHTVGLASSRAVTLNPQESAIADLLVNSSGQKRPFLHLDPVLSQVARARAADMARRGYFAHVNPDGIGPNYLVEAAGYPLPASWGSDRSANYVESIAAGRDSASATWNDWMGSAPHKRHLLAETNFYQEQTSYGVGFVSDPSSQYVTYWVVITAPPRPTPSLAITSPAAGSRVIVPQVTLTGTTGGGTASQTVQFRVENATGVGAYKPATGVSTWTAVATNLIPGLNTIRVRSLDATGNLLAQASREVRYAVMKPLTVSISGGGTVSPGFVGESQRELGMRYTIVAKPAADLLFAGWTGGVSSTKASLTFTMSEGLQLTANFVPNPFLNRRGSYRGVVTVAGDSSGLINVALTASGGFTGRLTIGGATHSLSGKLGVDGTATVIVPRRGKSPLTVSLQLDVNGSGGISARVSDGTFAASSNASRVYRSKESTFAKAGRYTVSFAANPQTEGDTKVPQGNGYATLVVSGKGRAVILGKLADGSSFSQSATVSEQGSLAIYKPLYRGAGFAAGELVFNSTPVSDLDGTLLWSKSPLSGDRFYPAGFKITLPIVGSRYAAPAPGAVDNGHSATLSLGDGNLSAPLVQSLSIDVTNRVRLSAPAARGLSVRVSPATGIYTGTFTHPVSGQSRPIRGVIFQKQNAGYGYFLGIDQSGYSSLTIGQG